MSGVASAGEDRRRAIPDGTQFRCAAAPWLDEDDLNAALQGPGASGAVWGDGRPWPEPDPPPWSDEAERRSRHAALLRRWDPGVSPPR